MLTKRVPLYAYRICKDSIRAKTTLSHMCVRCVYIYKLLKAGDVGALPRFCGVWPSEIGRMETYSHKMRVVRFPTKPYYTYIIYIIYIYLFEMGYMRYIYSSSSWRWKIFICDLWIRKVRDPPKDVLKLVHKHVQL